MLLLKRISGRALAAGAFQFSCRISGNRIFLLGAIRHGMHRPCDWRHNHCICSCAAHCCGASRRAKWRHGEVIPNENQLAREFNLSAGTVRKALEWMEQARLVVRQQGRGTFITDPMAPEFAGRFDTLHGADGRKLITIPASTAFETAPATPEEASALKLRGEGARVLRVRQTRRLASGPVIVVEQAALPAELYKGLTGTEAGGYDVVQASKQCNVMLGEGVERILDGKAARARGGRVRPHGREHGAGARSRDPYGRGGAGGTAQSLVQAGRQHLSGAPCLNCARERYAPLIHFEVPRN